MVNHARTLLANLAPGNLQGFGEEFIEPTFVPIRLPHSVQQVRSVLFGSAPDRWMINYRCCQLLQLLHGTTLVSLLTDLDPRLTYNQPASGISSLFDPVSYLPIVNPATAITISGNPEAPDRHGGMRHLFEIVRLDSDTVSVHRASPPTSKTVMSITLTSGVSEPLALIGSGYTCRILTATPVDTIVFVEVLNRPMSNVGALLPAVERLGAATIVDLFRLGNGYPFNSLYELWRKEKETPLRLAALVLAVIYRTEEVRKSG